VTFKIVFDDIDQVSATPYGYDSLVMIPKSSNVTQSLVEVQYENTANIFNYTYMLSLNSFDEEISADIPGFYEEDVGITVTKVFIGGTATVVAVTMIFTIISSKSLQDLWSIVNVQQLSLYIMVLDVANVPSNVVKFQDTLSGLNQRDMYPMDPINEFIFNFTESDSITDNFERLGLEGTNFIELTGSLLVNVILLVSSVMGVKLIQKICVRFH
jgi:hypothetical protein